MNDQVIAEFLKYLGLIVGTASAIWGAANELKEDDPRDFEVLSLRDEARELFINTILNPPAPNEAARSAADRYKKDMRL
jgi:uncharacterized protein (DUF1778 family)